MKYTEPSQAERWNVVPGPDGLTNPGGGGGGDLSSMRMTELDLPYGGCSVTEAALSVLGL